MLPFIIGLIGYGYYERRKLIVRKYNVYFEDLPAQFNGYSILHLSDLHISKRTKWVRIIGEYVQNLPADLAVITGDFRYQYHTENRGVFEAMKELSTAFRTGDGVFGCLGNNDSVRMIPGLENSGIRILRNSNIKLTRNGAEIYLLGVDERNPYKDFSTDSMDSLRGVGKDAFKILLSHTPDYIKWSKGYGVDLLLAGDTHGGQIRLPLLGPPRVKSRLSRKYCRGWIREGGTRLFINSGLGYVGLPLRTFCPPEIVHITLRKRGL